MKMNLLILTIFLLNFSGVVENKIYARSNSKPLLTLQSIVTAAPWCGGKEPYRLPKDWNKHQAKHEFIVYYNEVKIKIHKGDTYFTYKGKVAIGFHGTINPPMDMS